MNKQVDDLKSKGLFREAGSAAAAAGMERSYGCHFGMRSTRRVAVETFLMGYDAQMEVIAILKNGAE